VCNLYHHIRPDARAASQTEETPTLSSTPPLKMEITDSSAPLRGDMKTFAERVVNALCPPEKRYAPIIVKEVKTIYDVLAERKDFSEWFNKVRQILSIKNYQLAQILYDSLEGLTSQEARQLREEWYSFIQAQMKGYGLI
jgi:hypothetical protein